MSRGINKVILIGIAGRDPEIKTFQNGGKIVSTSIGTNESWTDKATGEKKESTEWHKVTFTGKLADLSIEYLRKGIKVYIEGSLKNRTWKDAQGVQKHMTEIHVKEFQILTSKRGEPETMQTNVPENIGNRASENLFDEQLPF